MDKKYFLIICISGLLIACSPRVQKINLSDVKINKNVQKVLAKKIIFNACSFPKSLKLSIESELKIKCSKVTVKDLSQVKILNLKNISSKEIKILDSRLASYFTNLEYINLSHNPELRKIPDFVFYNLGLKKLDISYTGISNFSDQFCQLNQLQILKAHHNFYEGQEIPIAVFCLKKLRVLDMSYSSIHYIDEYIYYLKNLKELYLRKNLLVAVPIVLHMMPNIEVLDLRENRFSNYTISTLYNCAEITDVEQKKECKAEIVNSIGCEYWYKLHFQRGKSFRNRYTEMTGAEFKSKVESQSQAGCYNYWLDSYVSFFDSNKKYLHEMTVNGKTMREYRLAWDILITQSPVADMCEWQKMGFISNDHEDDMFPVLNYFPKVRSHPYIAGSMEFYPSRYRSPDWIQPKECAVINYDMPAVPMEKLGPWTKALLVVEATILKRHPRTIGCKHWPTSECNYSSYLGFVPMEFNYLGRHSMGIQLDKPIQDYRIYTNKKNVQDLLYLLEAEKHIKVQAKPSFLETWLNIKRKHNVDQEEDKFHILKLEK